MQPKPRVKVTSSGGVVYRLEPTGPLFLLLGSNKRGTRCLPKGLIEENEDELTTAMREVREETGVSRVKLKGKVGLIKYQFGFRSRTFDKTVHFYLFETDQADAKVGTEHDFMEWLSYDDALKSLSYPNEKEILTKAWNMIRLQPPASKDAASKVNVVPPSKNS